MSKRSKPRSGSMLLKFSNTSVTSARATHARHNIPDQQPENAKRRRFFNSSTELFPILGLMLMSLCRQVTSLCYLKRRLIAYGAIIVIGGILHDFASILLRALFFHLSSGHFFNWFFVKFGWAWNVCLLLPLISLSAHALNSLNDIELDKIEKSIEQFHERRLRLLANQKRASVSGMAGPGLYALAPPPKTIVSLQSISSNSNNSPSKVVEQCQQRILSSERHSHGSNSALTRAKQALVNMVRVLCVRDVCRLALCTVAYSLSIMSFRYIQAITSKSVKTNGQAVVVATANGARASSPQDLTYPGLDISGHVYILIFSNLIFLEECNIMTGWEPLGDRLFALSREYMNLEMDSLMGSPLSGASTSSTTTGQPVWQVSDANRSLFLAWHTFHHHTTKLRVFFLLATLLTLLWDFMLVQTACFYHSLIEKAIALLWALACWYITYRVLFRSLQIEVKKPTAIQAEAPPSSSAPGTSRG